MLGSDPTPPGLAEMGGVPSGASRCDSDTDFFHDRPGQRHRRVCLDRHRARPPTDPHPRARCPPARECQTVAHWQQTPDGRPGFAEVRGHVVYVVDLPRIGRSRPHHATQRTTSPLGRRNHGTGVHRRSVLSGWPGAELRTHSPGTGRVTARHRCPERLLHVGRVGVSLALTLGRKKRQPSPAE